MAHIREILAFNLKKYRKILGLTQPQLAEKADVSTHYIAMIETCNKYPKPEMLERIAKALEIEPNQLFSTADTYDEALERLHQTIITDMQQALKDMKQVVKEAVKDTLNNERIVKNNQKYKPTLAQPRT
jgi:transcriptional regulator with XRE-family HTH domain